jgi:hypothetical protein
MTVQSFAMKLSLDLDLAISIYFDTMTHNIT